jgi:hypothetical protein
MITCGDSLRCWYMRARYSPITPSRRLLMPIDKVSSTVSVVNPGGQLEPMTKRAIG